MRKHIPIFYSAVLLTAVNLLMRLVTTAFQVYLSRQIGAEGIGLVQLVLSVSVMGTTLGIAGIRTATMYLCAEEIGRGQEDHVPWILSGCIRYSLLAGGGAALLIFLFAPKITTHWIGNPDTVNALRLFAAFLPVICLSGVLSGLFTAAGQILTLALVGICEHFTAMGITMAALTFWAGSSPERAAMSVILGNGIGSFVSLCSLIFLRLFQHPSTGNRIPVAKRLWNIAAPLALADDLKSCISTTENLMVPKRLALFPSGTSPLAMFGMILGMVFPIIMFPAAILFGLAELMVPELARCSAAHSKKRISYLTRRSLRVALFYGVLMGGILFLLSDVLCPLLYKTSQPVFYLRLFACLIPMLYCDIITDSIIKGLGQQKHSVRINIFTSLLDVILLYLLLPQYGLPGYFFSFFVTHLINFLLSMGRLLHITKEQIPLSVPFRTLLCFGLSLWGCGKCQSALLGAVFYPALLFSSLFLFGVLQKEDVCWLSGLIKSPRQPAGDKLGL